jgi:hypothetical protein
MYKKLLNQWFIVVKFKPLQMFYFAIMIWLDVPEYLYRS